MGLKAKIGRLLSFTRVDRGGAKVAAIKYNPGGGENNTGTGDYYQPSGEDSQPLADDYLVIVPGPLTGVGVVVGVVDTKNEGVAGAGEKRIYARDQDGNPVNQIWLRADGSVLVSNDSGAIELKANGEIDLNGFIIDTSGNATTPGDVEVFNTAVPVTVGTHVHLSATPGNPSGPPIP